MNRILIIALFGSATAFLAPALTRLPCDPSLGGDNEHSISGTRIINEHTKENCLSNRRSNRLLPRGVGGP